MTLCGVQAMLRAAVAAFKAGPLHTVAHLAGACIRLDYLS